MKKPIRFPEPVYVTKPFLPPLEEFKLGLEEIWKNQWLTNDGPIIRRFQDLLSEKLKTDNISLFNNGTLALQIGLQGLGISGEVITTPFTFVATTHALYWNKLRPVFCDIDNNTYNIDPDKIESLITPWTSAILAVHTFGTPCDVNKLKYIAEKHKLFLIYDSAHAFGMEIDGIPISSYGDMNMFSFHATKTYHSFEGGLLTFADVSLKKKLNYLKNFGFENEVEVVMPGTNAKMSEVHALMGMYNLKYLNAQIEKRKKITELYCQQLSNVNGITLPKENNNVKRTYPYLPIRVNTEMFGMSRDHLYTQLKEFNIFTRRYFYPLIPDFPCYKSIQLFQTIDTAQKVANEILTLPIYYDLEVDEVANICEAIIFLHKKGYRGE